MADIKISALPVATTPLAGTEVLPIVQSGITAKVAVSNLTAGRAVNASALTLTGGLLTQAAGANVASAATIDLSTATGNMPRITGTTPTSAVTMNTGQWAMTIANAAWPLVYNATTHKINTNGANITLEAGDRVLYHKDLSGIVHGMIIKSNGTAVNEHVFDVLDYGATGDGVTDDSAAVATAIAAAKASTRGPGYGTLTRSGVVFFPKGTYRGLAALNCTGAVGLILRGEAGWGSALYFDGLTAAGQPCVDFSGSSYCGIENLTIHGTDTAGVVPTNVAGCAVLVADSVANPQLSNKNIFNSCNIFGFFTKAALAIYRSTNNNFYNCAVQTNSLAGAALFVGNTNPLTLSSAYATLESAGFVANENAFFGCEFHGANSASATQDTLAFGGANQVQFFGGIVDCNGATRAYANWSASGRGYLFSGVKFYSENGTFCKDLFVAAAAVEVNQLTTIGSYQYSAITGSGMVIGAGATFPNARLSGMNQSSLNGTGIYFAAEQMITLGACNGNTGISLSAGTSRFLGAGDFNDSSESSVRIRVPRSGTIVGIYANTSGSPGAGQSYTVTLRVNGVDTGVSTAINDANTAASNLTATTNVAVGDYISARVTASASSGSTGSMWSTYGFIPSAP